MTESDHASPAPATADLVLTRDEAAQLDQLEAVIEGGLHTFMEVGAALLAVRDRRLYRTDYRSFGEYLAERWRISTSYATQLIGAARTVGGMVAIATPPELLPATESQARELSGLEPEQAAAVMAAATDDGPPTAVKIREKRRQVAPPQPNGSGPTDPPVVTRTRRPRRPSLWGNATKVRQDMDKLTRAVNLLRTDSRYKAEHRQFSNYLRWSVADLRGELDALAIPEWVERKDPNVVDLDQPADDAS